MKIKQFFSGKTENSMVFFNFLSPIVLNGINFFTVPIFTRMLGTANYGIMALYTTWVSIFTIFIGLKVEGTISVAKVHFDDKEMDSYYSSVLGLSLISFVAIFGICFVFQNSIIAFMQMSKPIVMTMLLQSFGAFCISFFSVRFIFRKDGMKNFLLSISVSLVTVVLSMLFIFHIPNYSDRYLGKIYGTAIPTVAVGIGAFAFIMLKGKKLFSPRYWKFCLPLALPLIFHGLSQTVLSQTDRLVLQHFSTQSSVGIYSLCSSFTSIISIIYMALNTSWVPFYYDFVKAGDTEAIHKKTQNYIHFFTLIAIGFVLLSPEALKLFASSDFSDGTNLIPIFVLQFYMIFLYSFPVNFEFYHKKTALLALGTCGAAVINVGLNLLLVPVWNIFGSALATMISYTMLFVFHELIAKYVIKKNYQYSFKTFLPGLAVVLACCGLFYFTRNLWYVRWALAGAAGVLLVRRVIKNRSIF